MLVPVAVLAAACGLLLRHVAKRGLRRVAEDSARSEVFQVLILGSIVATAASVVITQTEAPAPAGWERLRADRILENALDLVAAGDGRTDGLVLLATEIVNGENGPMRQRFAEAMRGLHYRILLTDGVHEWTLLEERGRPAGPSVSASRGFVSEFSYVFATPGLDLVDGISPLDARVLLVSHAEHRALAGSPIVVTVDASGNRTTTASAVPATSKGLGPTSAGTRLALTEFGRHDREQTWSWGVDPLRPQEPRAFDLRPIGDIPEGATLKLTPPPGWTFDDDFVIVRGWIRADPAGWNFTRAAAATESLIRLAPHPQDSLRSLDPFQTMHAELRGPDGAFLAQATYVLPFPGTDAATGHRLVVNTPWPWRPGEVNRITVAYLNGAREARTLDELRIAAPPGLFDASPVTVTVRGEGEPDVVLTGTFAHDGTLTITPERAQLRHAGALYTGADRLGLPRLFAASGVTTILIDARTNATPPPLAADPRVPVHADLSFANGLFWKVSTYGEAPGIFRAVVPAATTAGGGDGYPHPASAVGVPPETYSVVAGSTALPDAIATTFEYSVLRESDPAGTLAARLAAYRDAYRESHLTLSATSIRAGDTLVLDSDFEALLLELAERGATGIEHEVRIYTPPSLGKKPTEIRASSAAAVGLLAPFGHAAAWDPSGLGQERVVLASGARLVVLDAATGAIAHRLGVDGSVAALLAWPKEVAVGPFATPVPPIELLAVAHGDGLTVFDGEGRKLWTREAPAEFLATGPALDEGHLLAVAAEGSVRLFDHEGVERRAYVLPAGEVTGLAWHGQTVVVATLRGFYSVTPDAESVDSPQPVVLAEAGFAAPHVLPASGDVIAHGDALTARLRACGLGGCEAWERAHAGALSATTAAFGGALPLFVNTKGEIVVLDENGNERFVHALEVPVADLERYESEAETAARATNTCHFDDELVERNPGLTVFEREIRLPRPEDCREPFDEWMVKQYPADVAFDVVPQAFAEARALGRPVLVAGYLHTAAAAAAVSTAGTGVEGDVAAEAAVANHRIVAVDPDLGELWRVTLGATAGDAVVVLVAAGDDVYAGLADGTVRRFHAATGAERPLPEQPAERLGVFRNTFTPAPAGFTGAHPVTSVLSWDDPLLRTRVEATLLGLMDVLPPDGRDDRVVYTLSVQAWWPEDAVWRPLTNRTLE